MSDKINKIKVVIAFLSIHDLINYCVIPVSNGYCRHKICKRQHNWNSYRLDDIRGNWMLWLDDEVILGIFWEGCHEICVMRKIDIIWNCVL